MTQLDAGEDSIDKQLAALTDAGTVDAALAKMKAEIASAAPVHELPPAGDEHGS